MARDLLPGAILTLDAVAAQMAPLDASFATLDSGHLGDLGQSPGLGGCSAAHPGGRSAEGHSSGLCHSAIGREKRQMFACWDIHTDT